MLNGNLRIEKLSAQIENLKNRMKDFQSKLDLLVEKNYTLFELVERTDGDLKIIPELINIRQHQVDDTIIWIFRTLPTMYVGNTNLNIEFVNRKLLYYEMIYNSYLITYGEVLDDLIVLYSQKNGIVESKSNDNTKNYKLEILKMLNIFSIYGVTDESFIRFGMGLEAKHNEIIDNYLIKLNNVIDGIAPTEITVVDFSKIKDLLAKLSRINLFDDKTKNDIYNSIDEYIEELESRKYHIKK